MTKKFIFALILIFLVGYYATNTVKTSIKNKGKAEVLRQQKDGEKLEIVTLVRQLAFRTNAISDWPARLSGDSGGRYDQILTVELERLWYSKRPILFAGTIQDIKTRDSDNYTMLIERDRSTSFGHNFGTYMQLSLIAPKYEVDLLLKKFPDLIKGYRRDRVAVVAKIDSIETTYFSGEECVREEIKVGYGSLVDLEYVGDVRLTKEIQDL